MLGMVPRVRVPLSGPVPFFQETKIERKPAWYSDPSHRLCVAVRDNHPGFRSKSFCIVFTRSVRALALDSLRLQRELYVINCFDAFPPYPEGILGSKGDFKSSGYEPLFSPNGPLLQVVGA